MFNSKIAYTFSVDIIHEMVIFSQIVDKMVSIAYYSAKLSH